MTEPKLYCVCEVDKNGKVLDRGSDALPFDQARDRAKQWTRRYLPVPVEHYEWLQERRANNTQAR